MIGQWTTTWKYNAVTTITRTRSKSIKPSAMNFSFSQTPKQIIIDLFHRPILYSSYAITSAHKIHKLKLSIFLLHLFPLNIGRIPIQHLLSRSFQTYTRLEQVFYLTSQAKISPLRHTSSLYRVLAWNHPTSRSTTFFQHILQRSAIIPIFPFFFFFFFHICKLHSSPIDRVTHQIRFMSQGVNIIYLHTIERLSVSPSERWLCS